MKTQNRSTIRFRLWHMFFFMFACSVTILLVRNHMLDSEAIVLMGQVVDESGTPVPNAKVSVSSNSDDPTGVSISFPAMVTDAAGRFRRGHFA